MTTDWNLITEKHGPAVWKAVYRILQSHSESLDCYQEIMLEAFEHSKKKNINSWPGFLRWLAVRRAIDALRKRYRNQSHLDHSRDVGLESLPCNPSDALEMEELLERLRGELVKLPQTMAEAFWLRFVEQMNYAEIADHLEIESSTVGVLIHRGRQRICKAISDLQPTQ